MKTRLVRVHFGLPTPTVLQKFFFSKKGQREPENQNVQKIHTESPFTQTNLASRTTSCTEGMTLRAGTKWRSSNEAENVRTAEQVRKALYLLMKAF